MKRPGVLMSNRGSALLLVLWALLMLSAAVLGWVKFLDQDINRLSQSNFGLEAKANARSGIAVALHPLVTPITPLLQKDLGNGSGYKVRLTGEGGKLNINWLLAGEDPIRLEILKRLLAQKFKIQFQDTQALVDAMLDWIDPDNDKHLNGMEATDDYLPANRPFQSVEEIAQVWGAEILEETPGWQDLFTIFTQGPVDVLAASEEVLAILPGVGDARARNFIKFRDGQDKLNGTRDDYAFQGGMDEVMSYLGIGQQQRGELQPVITMKDPTFFIVSEGYAGKVVRQVTVVARKGNAAPAILKWNEF